MPVQPLGDQFITKAPGPTAPTSSTCPVARQPAPSSGGVAGAPDAAAPSAADLLSVFQFDECYFYQ